MREGQSCALSHRHFIHLNAMLALEIYVDFTPNHLSVHLSGNFSATCPVTPGITRVTLNCLLPPSHFFQAAEAIVIHSCIFCVFCIPLMYSTVLLN